MFSYLVVSAEASVSCSTERDCLFNSDMAEAVGYLNEALAYSKIGCDLGGELLCSNVERLKKIPIRKSPLVGNDSDLGKNKAEYVWLCRQLFSKDADCFSIKDKLLKIGELDAAIEVLQGLCSKGSDKACSEAPMIALKTGKADVAFELYKNLCEKLNGHYCIEAASLAIKLGDEEYARSVHLKLCTSGRSESCNISNALAQSLSLSAIKEENRKAEIERVKAEERRVQKEREIADEKNAELIRAGAQQMADSIKTRYGVPKKTTRCVGNYQSGVGYVTECDENSY